MVQKRGIINIPSGEPETPFLGIFIQIQNVKTPKDPKNVLHP
jgi:hypothetical protein